MRKNAFTLIELLAVVVILLAISVVAISSITSAIERNKVKQDNAKIEMIISYAKLYYEEHKNSEKDGIIYLGDLDLTDAESRDANGEFFNGVVCYGIGGTNFRYDEDGSC